MRVLNDPVQEDSIWMNGPPTISYINLAMAAAGGKPTSVEFAEAIEPFFRMSENFRSRLRDQWNLRALTHTDGSVAPAETKRPLELGAPREQGHCECTVHHGHHSAALDPYRCVLALGLDSESSDAVRLLVTRRWLHADGSLPPATPQRSGR
jgi:hypothetical protein